jgi:hypothetical protein
MGALQAPYIMASLPLTILFYLFSLPLIFPHTAVTAWKFVDSSYIREGDLSVSGALRGRPMVRRRQQQY